MSLSSLHKKGWRLAVMLLPSIVVVCEADELEKGQVNKCVSCSEKRGNGFLGLSYSAAMRRVVPVSWFWTWEGYWLESVAHGPVEPKLGPSWASFLWIQVLTFSLITSEIQECRNHTSRKAMKWRKRMSLGHRASSLRLCSSQTKPQRIWKHTPVSLQLLIEHIAHPVPKVLQNVKC